MSPNVCYLCLRSVHHRERGAKQVVGSSKHEKEPGEGRGVR